MSRGGSAFAVRPVAPADISDLCALLNEIIRIGGTTAMETPMSVESFLDAFFRSQIQMAFTVAEGAGSNLLGFQVLATHEKLPDGWADIATFARVGSQAVGVGSALFSETLAQARRFELVAINATIRADNTGGLAYYDAMGFSTYRIDRDVPLKSGWPVDRISKRRAIDAPES